MNTNMKTALVLGANGGIGGETMRALLRRGWNVRALVRRLPEMTAERSHPNLEWVRGDALVQQDVVSAAADVAVIVHAVNPANYHNWSGLVMPMLENSIAAAAVAGARIVLPGTLYNYGEDAFPNVAEDSPQHPRSRKGKIRAAMEQRLRDASAQGVRSLVVRAGDFFGPSAVSSWFSQGVIIPGQRWLMNPGAKGMLHSWAYLPDVAETIARLLEQQESLQDFDVYHFRGHAIRNADLLKLICGIRGMSVKRVLPFPWWAIGSGAPFSELCREMWEMRYLWREPIELDNAKLRSAIGMEAHTPLEVAVRATLAAIGCNDRPAAQPMQRAA